MEDEAKSEDLPVTGEKYFRDEEMFHLNDRGKLPFFRDSSISGRISFLFVKFYTVLYNGYKKEKEEIQA